MRRPIRLYLSGPMTGYPDHNSAAFNAAAEFLRGKGYEVISPVELDHNSDLDVSGDGWNVDEETYEHLLARDLNQVEGVDAVVMLPGWQRSGGAGREGERALELGIPMYSLRPMPFGSQLVELPGWLFRKHHTTQRLTRESV